MNNHIKKLFDFLNAHPALNFNFFSTIAQRNFLDNIEMMDVDEYGIGRVDDEEVMFISSEALKNIDSKRFKELKLSEDFEELIPYQLAFGKKWKRYNTLYSTKLYFYVFDEDFYKKVGLTREEFSNFPPFYQFLKFESHSFYPIVGYTFEDLLYNYVDVVIKKLGRYSFVDFLSDEEEMKFPNINLSWETINRRWKYIYFEKHKEEITGEIKNERKRSSDS